MSRSSISNKKLDYLSQQYGDHPAKNRPPKKKSKTTNRLVDEVQWHDMDGDEGGGDSRMKKNRKTAHTKTHTVVNVDGQATTHTHQRHDSTDDDDDDEHDEDAPVVVPLEEAGGDNILDNGGPTSNRGTWNECHANTGTSTTTTFVPEPTNDSTLPRPRRRRRHDSDDPQPTHAAATPTTTRLHTDHPLTHRQHHDSDEKTQSVRHQQSLRRPPSPQRRRRRHDSDDSDPDNHESNTSTNSKNNKSITRHEQTHDNNNGQSTRQQRRRRHDSSSDDEPNESQNNNSSKTLKTTTTTPPIVVGHRAGRHSGQAFAQTEAMVQHAKRSAAQSMVDRHGVGETVRRDAVTGVKLPHQQPDSAAAAASAAKTSNPQKQLLRTAGRVQLAEAERQRQTMATLHEALFARHQDDSELEQHRKLAIRPDDPMAAHHQKHRPSGRNQNKTGESTQQPHQRPVYSGPPAKPNRFGILPGHRWDARDRGNGFEDKLLAKRFSSQHQQEKAYRFSAADM